MSYPKSYNPERYTIIEKELNAIRDMVDKDHEYIYFSYEALDAARKAQTMFGEWLYIMKTIVNPKDDRWNPIKWSTKVLRVGEGGDLHVKCHDGLVKVHTSREKVGDWEYLKQRYQEGGDLHYGREGNPDDDVGESDDLPDV